ncbi:MAG TPA: Fe-S cluster assembly protein SufD [Burkholderiaceae bacterium]|jgi:Fe-S cluster assembly protein SufD|nr:Fe-S cluster assembly protein SufD [Burkholderiaceae bacterium]
MTTQAKDRYLADFARVAATLPGANLPWLSKVRSSALERFAQTGFPTTRDEDWKYTSVAALEGKNFAVPGDKAADTAAAAMVPELALDREVSQNGHLLVFHNGQFSAALSAIGKLPAGATLQSLADALAQTPDALEPYLSDTQGLTPFGTLNTALMADGAYLRLQRGTVVEQPIHLLFISTQSQAAIYPRNVLVAEDGAQATVIEHYAGVDGAEYFTNAVTQIFTADNASIEHYKLQQEASQAFHVAGIHAMQNRDSRFASHSISLGASLARNDITTAFRATGCDVTFNGLYLVGGRQHVDHHTRIDHSQPNGSSHEYYRGVLDGAARAVFNGKVVVHADAQKTDAHQANHNLLLSRNAEVDTKPELEIYANDVKCTHGATVGQIDAEQLFYLQSRGIDEKAARSLLVHAFAHDVIERIRVTALRARLEQILLERLPQGDLIRELS